ncbi:MAG: iron ABC transporter substrate-binding protein [Candidatus Limnocylindria bacterium]
MRTLAVALALVVAVVSTGCQAGERTLTIYSGRTRSLVHPVLEQFSKDTGIAIRVRYGDTAEIAATILEEGANSPADVFFAQDAGALGALTDAGLLQVLPDEVLGKVPEPFRSPDGRWVGVSGRSRVIAYNTDRVTPADLPASVLEMTDPKWRGRVGWAPTNASFQAFVTALRVDRGEAAARDWLVAMKENARVYPNNITIVQAVAAGEVDVGLVNHYYLYPFLEEQGEGFKARNHFLGGGDIGALVNVAGAGILETSKNVADARRFVEYLLGPAAQRFFAEETYEYPVIDGVSTAAELPPISSLQPPDVDLNGLADLEGTLALLRETGVLP